jgi:hypothetical protein
MDICIQLADPISTWILLNMKSHEIEVLRGFW